MKKIMIFCLLAVLMFTNFSFAAEVTEVAEKENIALGKTVTAKNTHGASYAAKYAVDGNSSTIWSSPDGGGEFLLDLGSVYAIEAVEIQARQNMEQSFLFPAVYGATDADFIQFDILSELDKTVPAKGTVRAEIESKKKYRYIKLIFPKYSTPAEIRVFEKELPDTGIDAIELHYPDVTSLELKNALGLLGGFGIELTKTGETEFSADTEVTRAQFADVLVKTIGLEGMTHETSPFRDIAGILEESSINTLYSLGAVEEYAVGLFKPSLTLTPYQAAEITVKALGYAQYAEATGKPETACRMKISELSLMKSVTSSGKLTRKDAAFLLVNALHAKVMDISAIGNKGVQYIPGKTLLQCRGFYYGEGVVTENYSMSFNYTWVDVAEGRVVIEDETYDVAYNNLMYHVGDKVRYYYKESENGRKTVIFMHPVLSQTEIIIPAEKLENISGRTVTWYDGDKPKSKSFTAGARVIYNGRPLSGNGDISQYQPTAGYVRMLDYDGSGGYDTVILFDYQDRVVKRINQKENTFFFEADQPALRVAQNQTAVYYRDGKIVNPQAIKVGDVLSIGTSDDGNHYEVYISRSKKEGKITGYAQGEDESIEIDYLKEYPVSASFMNPMDIKLGERGTLYINYEGKAAFFDTEAFSGYRYGFLTNTKLDGGFSDVLWVQIYTQESSLEAFPVREKALLDGQSYSSPTAFRGDLQNRLTANEGQHGDCGRLVRYRIDINLEIIEIDTLYDNAETDGFTKTGEITSAYIMYGIFDGRYILDTDTTVFYIYGTESEVMSDPEDKYGVKTVSESFKDRHSYENVEFYGEAADLLSPLPVAVVRGGTAENDVGEDAYTVLVDTVSQGLNKNEDVVPVICGMYKGNYIKLPFADTDDIPTWIPSVSFGDIIRVATNKYNEISVCEFVGEYDIQAPATDTLLNIHTTSTYNSHMGPRFMMLGGAYAMDGDLLCIKPIDGMETNDEVHLVHISRFENVYLCDTKGRKIRSATTDEIFDYVSDSQNYSYIFCRLNSGYHRDLIIYSR